MFFPKSSFLLIFVAVIVTALIAVAMVACGGSSNNSNIQTGGGGGGGTNLGAVQNPAPLSACPAGDWFQYTDTAGTDHPMNCVSATLASCPNVGDLAFTYGYLSPSGIISGPVKGVIVYFDGGV